MPFESILVRSSDRAQAQRLAQTSIVAGVIHLVALFGALLHGRWKVDELSPPRAPLQLFQPPRMPPLAPRVAAEAAPTPSAVVDRRHSRVPPRKAAALVPPRSEAPALAPALPAPEAEAEGNIEEDGIGEGAGTDAPGSPGGGPGSVGEGAAQGRTLPPIVGARRCLACPDPQLPPAYLQVVPKATLASRICVDKNGLVSTVDVLQGISDGIDAQVVQQLRRWRFHPMTVNGNPVPFCYPAIFVWKSVR